MTRLAAMLAAVALAFAPAAQAKEWAHITIATEGAFPPYNFHAPDGSLAGFEIDYAHVLCANMKVKCDIIAQDWDGIIPGLQAGKYDAIMAAMSITPKRMEVLAFAGPYIASPTTFVMSKDAGGKLPLTGQTIRLDDAAAAKTALEPLRQALKGKILGVQVSTIQSDVANLYLKDVVAEIRTYKTTQEEDLDIQAGRIDAICGSQATLAASLEKPGGDVAVMAGPLLRGGATGTGSGVGLRKTDPELKTMFDGAIEAAKADGTTKALYMKWFKVDLTPQ
ncbi:transporter substrate-binding domain-containing protein [Acidisphaera sp. L21]|uniref:transporter substrate-binding domain-containing protein n=1 Tax=Acidisphaera sp. L21 TaxID=1641851 RepID=UPI0020B1127E|nr:transporter substrate-binding domain-containing protein [Acidisphaera sp. L21]